MLKYILRMIAWDWTQHSLIIVPQREQMIETSGSKGRSEIRDLFLSQDEGIQSNKSHITSDGKDEWDPSKPQSGP